MGHRESFSQIIISCCKQASYQLISLFSNWLYTYHILKIFFMFGKNIEYSQLNQNFQLLIEQFILKVQFPRRDKYFMLAVLQGSTHHHLLFKCTKRSVVPRVSLLPAKSDLRRETLGTRLMFCEELLKGAISAVYWRATVYTSIKIQVVRYMIYCSLFSSVNIDCFLFPLVQALIVERRSDTPLGISRSFSLTSAYSNCSRH